MILIKNYKKIIFILFLFFDFIIFDFEVYSINSETETNHIIPHRVYRTSPSKPKEKFLLGFSRNREFHSDLGLHITGDPGQLSGFISTTSNRQYAVSFAQAYAMGWWNVREFYLYEIVPQSNFVSVAGTYERTLRETTDPIIRSQLENLRYNYTWENEYSALYEIHPETIISATRFEFDPNVRAFIEREEIINTVTRESRTEPHVVPMLHPDTYSIGTYRNFQYSYNGTSFGFACDEYISSANINVSQHAIMKRQNNLTKNGMCPSEGLKLLEVIENPNYFLPKTQFKFTVNVFNKNYCLNPINQYYVYIDFCEKSPFWNFTEFGQIITQINDGKNSQYYCLTAGKIKNDYVKLEICDLNNHKQYWKLIQINSDYFIISTLDNRYISSGYNYYIYLENYYTKESSVKITKNEKIFTNKKANALIQFSVDPLMVQNKYVLYPTTKGYMFMTSPFYLSKYVNYYNAHNNTLFSSYGHGRNGPQVCYYSSLLKNGGSAWDWVKSDYCSNQGRVSPEYRWFFKLDKNKVDFNIFDFSDNILRFDDIYASSNRYFAYTTTDKWLDKNKYIESVKLNLPASFYARTFSSTFTIQKEQKHYKNQKSYNEIKNFFSGIYHDLNERYQVKN